MSLTAIYAHLTQTSAYAAASPESMGTEYGCRVLPSPIPGKECLRRRSAISIRHYRWQKYIQPSLITSIIMMKSKSK